MPFLPETGSLFDATGDLQLEVKQPLETSQEMFTVISESHHIGGITMMYVQNRSRQGYQYWEMPCFGVTCQDEFKSVEG